ncbi:SprT-like domain-containing protein [Treponema sp. R80B11-R83G3]
MITREQFQLFDELYQYYNNELFGGTLADCIIITQKSKKATGSFSPARWKNKIKDDEQNIHEITLNPECLDGPDEEWQQTLVHEMVHLWQRDFGKISRAGYHNKQWADKMEEIGLMPSSTGREGGKKTGQRMSDYIIPGGLFIEAYKRLKNKKLKYATNPVFFDGSKIPGKKSRSKTKYTCACNNNIWGKPGLSVTCNNCKKLYIEAE